MSSEYQLAPTSGSEDNTLRSAERQAEIGAQRLPVGPDDGDFLDRRGVEGGLPHGRRYRPAAQLSTPRAANPSSVAITWVTRDSASAIARRAEVSTSSWPWRSISPPSQKSNATKGAPASNAPTAIATIFRRENTRTIKPILVSG